MRPRQIKRIRLALGASQSVFAYILNVSPKVVQSWEHGARRPTSAALKLLSIAQSNPQILLQSETACRPRVERRRGGLSHWRRSRLLAFVVSSNETLVRRHLHARPH